MLPATPNVKIRSQNSNSLSQNISRTEFLQNKFRREQIDNILLSSEDTSQMDKSSKEKFTDKTIDQVCHFYKKGKCKHGLKGRNCPYTHPKACPKLLKFGNKAPKGCNQGIKCPNFHPRMCSSSIRRGECLNQSCTFTHVKGTKRKPTQNNLNNNQGPTDFLKILDNSRTEMITLINNNLQAISHQPISQIFPQRLSNVPIQQQATIQRMPIHNQNVLPHPSRHPPMEAQTVPINLNHH